MCFAEIKMLTRLKHHNIVRLLGFCVEGSEKILVIENFSNGYLADYFGKANKIRIFNWESRLKICIDVAHALNYLHSQMESQNMVINRDIRSQNIGLDENWGAKIVEFEFSVFLPTNQEGKTLYFNEIVGAECYIDPEYVKTSKLKRESDVYSFGVVLFEILCGRIAYDQIYLNESEKGLVNVARKRFSEGRFEEMIDLIIKEETHDNKFVLNRGPNKDSLDKFIKIAYQCVTETQHQRPTMEVIVTELEKALLLQENNKDNLIISLDDIKLATKNFHHDNYISRGGFGKVYKGKLQRGDESTTIVAKQLDKNSDQGEQQFLSELQILWEYKHENIIGLVGYCDEENEKVIVYEYASRKSLDTYVNDPTLTWITRLNICIEVASALEFLHGGVGKQAKVIHRDIKTANILLNQDWKAKLADFGLSLISSITRKSDYVINPACGTPGYMDPLYEKSGLLTMESDIYSFGVVLFEVLCGRSTSSITEHESRDLPDLIKRKFEEGKHDEVVFQQIKNHIMPKSLTTFQAIAYECLHHEREKRPTIKKVLTQLKKARELQNMASTITRFAHLQIPYEDVLKATNNFHLDNIITQGGSTTSYKGRLLRPGRFISIVARRFDCKNGEGDLEFLTEISVLSDLKHKNLVSIIGFVDEKDEKITITANETKGSLRQYLNNPNLTWPQRLRISVDVACVLSYLHNNKARGYDILHCNINSDTIMLDENWEARLCGFQKSFKRLLYLKDNVCFCEHIDNLGYVDPAIKDTGGVTRKSDIYTFGVVLFEILCCRKAVVQEEDNSFLAPLARYHYKNKTLHNIVIADLYDQMSPQSLFIFSNIAYSCLNKDPAERPYMTYILPKLEKALELQLRRTYIEKNLKHLKICLSDIKLATEDFAETYKIKGTGLCTLYRAGLVHVNKENPSFIEGKNKDEPTKRCTTVVIKRILPKEDKAGEEIFYTEIEMLTSVKHRNIVGLLGYCVEGSEMILITENVSNGYLADYLGNINKMRILTWENRLKICINIAHALNYLHSQIKGKNMVINRDIKSQNIGLDENWEGKIVEFGLSLFLPQNLKDNTLYLNSVYGTPLYWDPEYEKTGKLKRESDVYSFGVVLFEILCGRVARDQIYKKESHKGLADVARRSFHRGTLYDMIDPIMKDKTGENSSVPKSNSLDTFIKIAYECVAESQDLRPTMEVVVTKLEKALFLQISKDELASASISLQV